jgi:type IV pilus assembly protein PilA
MSAYPPQQQQPPGGMGGGYPGPMGQIPQKKGMSTGVILAIVAVVVVGGLLLIFFVLGILGYYGTRKYVSNAKQAEVKNSLGQISKDAVSAYEMERSSDDVLSQGSTTTGITRKLCPSAQNPVPKNDSDVSGRKYMSSSSEWTSDTGWKCLRFEMSAPQYYQYNYTSDSTSFKAIGRGDLNGDRVFSRFEVEGRVQDGSLRVSPVISETNPEE